MTGKRVLAVLSIVVLATAVLPPAAAWTVNRRRVSRAARDAAALAERLQRAEWSLSITTLVGVLHGPGRMPVAASSAAGQWLTAPRESLVGVLDQRERLPIDPWGNSYLVNVAAGAESNHGATLWVLSAGPNGIIQTPFLASSDTPAGDDVAARVR